MIEYTNQDNKKFKSWMYFWVIMGSFVGLFVIYSFYFQKNYTILVEESCDPNTTQCFYRNCEQEECPPNELEYYSQYTIEASNFDVCRKTDSCNIESVCTDNNTLCTKIDCVPGIDQCYFSGNE